MSIDAPCCQSARLAVDHAEVNAQIRAMSNAPQAFSSTRDVEHQDRVPRRSPR
jgi:hypothetical protein